MFFSSPPASPLLPPTVPTNYMMGASRQLHVMCVLDLFALTSLPSLSLLFSVSRDTNFLSCGSHASLTLEWIVEGCVGRNRPGSLLFLPCQLLHESSSWQGGQQCLQLPLVLGTLPLPFMPGGWGWIPAVVNLWISPVSPVWCLNSFITHGINFLH